MPDLIVPVGDGKGEVMLASSWSGMKMRRGNLRLGGDATRAGGGGSNSSTRDWNWILMLVLGNRMVHLP